jgi:NRPS condensation-like uncharacterized protein
MDIEKIKEEVEEYLKRKENNLKRKQKHFPTILSKIPTLFMLMEKENFNKPLLTRMLETKYLMDIGTIDQEKGHKDMIEDILNINDKHNK